VRVEALLLKGDGPALELTRVAKLLRFFGIAAREVAVEEFAAEVGRGQLERYRLFSSSDSFSRLITILELKREVMDVWRARVHSAFVYAGVDRQALNKIVQTITGDGRARLVDGQAGFRDVVISGRMDELCGVMGGVRLTDTSAGGEARWSVEASNGSAETVMSLGAGGAFFRLRYEGTDVFLSMSHRVVDMDAELPNGVFDVREHALSAVPISLYVRWAFPRVCWESPGTNACLVIDDPLLQPTYGFLDFKRLLELMKKEGFSSNIAFIPWNWRRSDPRVVRLFKENPREYSLSVHGCDHTRGEFGSGDGARLYGTARRSLERMGCHEIRTGLSHDPIMVFPQGVFSEAAMKALRGAGFIGAVNNDTISVDSPPRTVRISDVWDVAVMKYSGFPLFTRRYPWDGIENFAFDSLLGKPAIAVIHHDFCRDQGSRLMQFVEDLNRLRCRLNWRGLGELVRRSCRQREVERGVREIEMYGLELRIENESTRARHVHIRRRECDGSWVKSIQGDSGEIGYAVANGCLSFDVELESGRSLLARVEVQDSDVAECGADPMSRRVHVAMRRAMSEVRDRYVMKYASFVPSRFMNVN
jgi:hypothetical protein